MAANLQCWLLAPEQSRNLLLLYISMPQIPAATRPFNLIHFIIGWKFDT